VWGSVPLHTLSADVDYGLSEAHTSYGIIGIKVWINRGKIGDPIEAAPRGRSTYDRGDREPRGGWRGGGRGGR
jgi:small subunit ribosomal protein S3